MKESGYSPRGVQMQTMRRRLETAEVVSTAPVGENASRQGKASETPAARRNRRRSSFIDGLPGGNSFFVSVVICVGKCRSEPLRGRANGIDSLGRALG